MSDSNYKSLSDEELRQASLEKRLASLDTSFPTLATEVTVPTIEGLLMQMVEKKASDLHIDTFTPPAYRIYGDIAKTLLSPFSMEDILEFVSPYLNSRDREIFELKGSVDFAVELKDLGRFRVNLYSYQKGLGLAFRHIPLKIPALEDLDLPPVLKDIAKYRKGLVIVTGATGSGKSTTLAAIIREINESRPAHILTVEDPIEYVHQNKTCLITHREVGRDATDFADALLAGIREDPDIILVGEMRDQETVRLAIKAAGMGFLVFSTLHTNTATGVIDRMVEIFPPEEQDEIRITLSESFRAAIAQQLLRRCDRTGRVASVEILLATSGLGNIIREKKTFYIPSIIQTSRDMGMQSMDQALVELLKEKKITLEMAKERIKDPRVLALAGYENVDLDGY